MFAIKLNIFYFFVIFQEKFLRSHSIISGSKYFLKKQEIYNVVFKGEVLNLLSNELYRSLKDIRNCNEHDMSYLNQEVIKNKFNNLDGVEVDNFDSLIPSQVESVEVIKDASASIYGMRGACGVIMITTKKQY